MISRLTIGIDIGGTNSDCVVLNESQHVVFSTKSATTADIVGGIDAILSQTLSSVTSVQQRAKAIFVSSTHATNALLEARNLLKVGVVRIASNNPVSIPSGLGWPETLHNALSLRTITIAGGHEVDGRTMDTLDPKALLNAVDTLVAQGAESIVLIGVFSPLYSSHENEAATFIASHYKDLPITCSRDVGGSGFVERENAAILNAALKKCVKQGFNQIESLCRGKGFNCPVFAVQNDGSTTSLEHACTFPISLLAAGPTNSCMGAAHLSTLNECVVVDIGGTSTDIGLVKNGIARRTFGTSTIAGVNLNFSMPDVFSLAMGGGSVVSFEQKQTPTIGPQSVGALLIQKAYCGGGTTLTLTDCALKCGYCTTINPATAAPLSKELAHTAITQTLQTIARAVERFACIEKEYPVVFVGGGSSLFPTDLIQTYFPHRQVVKPPNLGVANACGAACARVSGIVDETVCLDLKDTVMKTLRNKALERAIKNGADPKTIIIQDETVLPYAYVANSTARVRIAAAGKIKF